jgi:hypothetical protein
VIHCCQLLVCSLPRYMRAYRPLLSCNNSPMVAVARLVVSADVFVAWQCIFSALGNSAFQTTCHNINTRFPLGVAESCITSSGSENNGHLVHWDRHEYTKFYEGPHPLASTNGRDL